MLTHFCPNRLWLMMKTVDNETPLKIAVKYNRLHHLKELWPNSSILRDEKNPEYVHANKDRPDDNDGTGSNTTILGNILLRFYWSCRWSDEHEFKIEDTVSSILMNQSLEPNYYIEDGFTPLMIAVKYKRVKYVELLVKSPLCNREVFKKRSLCFKRTVLHICADIKDENITNLLLNKAQYIDLNVKSIDVMVNTPLHVCGKVNNIHMCKGLLSLGKNYPNLIFDPRTKKTQLEMKNNDGLTPLHEATRKKRDKIVKSILKCGGGSENLKQQLTMPTAKNLRTSLHLAAFKGNRKV